MSVASIISRVLMLMIVAVGATTGAVAAQQPAPARSDKPVVPAVVEQPRPFGYVVGDLVTQRVLLSAQGRDFEPAMPPPAQRVNIWFERRAPRIEAGSDGRRWLVVEHQVINAPREVATVSLPAWQLDSKAGNTRLGIPAAPITIAPLISVDSAPSAAGLRPDREASIVDPALARSRLLTWSIALLIALAAWFAWLRWREWRDSLDRPFARALRELRKVDDTTPEAWQAMHRAFDQTAGRVLQFDTLPALFERAPQLQPRHADIERFFAQSNERFFGAGPPGDLMSVRALCEELRRIERQHEP